jgi:hypothetical protein
MIKDKNNPAWFNSNKKKKKKEREKDRTVTSPYQIKRTVEKALLCKDKDILDLDLHACLFCSYLFINGSRKSLSLVITNQHNFTA